MSYNGYIAKLKNVRKHPNADRLLLGECFGNTVCVSVEYADNELGVYFPTDGQLSMEFCEQNNLVRKKDDAGNSIGGYMDASKRNVQAIRLRGEKSDGLFLHLNCLEYTGVNLNDLKEGNIINVVNGHEICQKYIPRRNPSRAVAAGNRTRKRKVPVAPLFAEHADTEQLAYNLNVFKPGDQIEITLKMHGTSQRTGYLPVFKGYKRTLLDKLLRREGTPIYDWGYVSGTRRTVLENYDGGYYGDNSFREEHSKMFEGKLWKGETFYLEVCGYINENTPIMGSIDNKKVNDKEFIKTYGKKTVFSYGCKPGESRMYVYRATMTNEDGDVIEYTPDFLRYRCEQIGLETVPVFWKGYIPNDVANAGEWVRKLAEQFYDGVDPIGKTHIREGIVIRIINRPKFTAYKHKNHNFKILSGIAVSEIENKKEIETLSEDLLAEM